MGGGETPTARSFIIFGKDGLAGEAADQKVRRCKWRAAGLVWSHLDQPGQERAPLREGLFLAAASGPVFEGWRFKQTHPRLYT